MSPFPQKSTKRGEGVMGFSHPFSCWSRVVVTFYQRKLEEGGEPFHGKMAKTLHETLYLFLDLVWIQIFMLYKTSGFKVSKGYAR
jgi:cytochrome b561